MVLKYMKKDVIVKEISIKTTQRYHFLSIRLAKNRKYNTFCWQGCGKILLCIVCGNDDQYNASRRKFGNSSQKLQMSLTFAPAIPLSGIYSEVKSPAIQNDEIGIVN